jgi:hypothetical protein
VVVVWVAGAAGVVVVVLVVVAGVEQPVSDTRAAAAKHERMNFFISMILFGL